LDAIGEGGDDLVAREIARPREDKRRRLRASVAEDSICIREPRQVLSRVDATHAQVEPLRDSCLAESGPARLERLLVR
jgi:hypothetical protein